MPKPWHQRQKKQGVKLVLSWFAPRKCWKKYHDGEVKYFKHPNSAEGYEAAVLEYHAWLHRAEAHPTAWSGIRAPHPSVPAMPRLVRAVRHARRRGGVCMPKSPSSLPLLKHILRQKNRCRPLPLACRMALPLPRRS